MLPGDSLASGSILSTSSATASRAWRASLPAARASYPTAGRRNRATSWVRRDYAKNLHVLPCEGADALDNGALGDLVVRDIVRANGGLLMRADLQQYQIKRREAVRALSRA